MRGCLLLLACAPQAIGDFLDLVPAYVDPRPCACHVVHDFPNLLRSVQFSIEISTAVVFICYLSVNVPNGLRCARLQCTLCCAPCLCGAQIDAFNGAGLRPYEP